ncbi:MAG TPA: hypothetical protein VGN07_13800 [Steroidobacteraceae bacterium]|jgi:hypothetical protein
MKTRTSSSIATLSVAALLPLLAVPGLSRAGAEQAFDSCVKAFISSSLEKERPTTVRFIDPVLSPLLRLDQNYRITLTAVGKYSGTKVAAATCITNRDGAVLSMNGKPYTMPTLADASTR